MKHPTWFLLAVLLLIALTGCSNNDQIPKKSHIVEIQGMQFLPASITVAKGDTIHFINKDFLQHNITESPTGSWQSDTLDTGEEYKMIATGNEDYFCSLHPVMKGKILIQ